MDAIESLQRATFDIAADHPALPGHFPGMPIVPGVVLLDEALHAIGQARDLPLASFRLASVKFLHPVVPPARLEVRHRMAASGAVEFSVADGDRVVASGRVNAHVGTDVGVLVDAHVGTDVEVLVDPHVGTDVGALVDPRAGTDVGTRKGSRFGTDTGTRVDSSPGRVDARNKQAAP